LDQNTTITFSGLEKKRTSSLDLLRGAIHFFSWAPLGLKVATPFVNGSVEGTEFFVRVEREHTFLSIFEGRVAATNEAGSLVLASGESAIAEAGQAPALVTVVRPMDAVQWALYYPPILEYRPADFPGGAETDWQGLTRKSIRFYWQGDLTQAFSSLQGAAEDIRDPRFFTYRAAIRLSVGRVDTATTDIERALTLDPGNSYAIALQAIIAVVNNQKDRAMTLAQEAVMRDPSSATATVAMSYVQQAHFDLSEALSYLQEAVKLDPENALAWARLAELLLSVGQLDKSSKAARKAVDLNPNIARTQTVLGFAFITRTKIKEALETFKKAIAMDSAAPLPRLGLGLAKIRKGDLKAGRGEIEIAATLDPNNSLIRSYLGKAYYEEKRDKLAKDQFEIAKQLDPKDPTPHFYDAIGKQTQNRPVEALQDLQKSIELNDNRAVYRSRLQLDQDLAARSASLGRIYNDLGFQQLALVEGWKSVNTDPANYSAHRFLADSYSVLPRHEIARVSELLQSQLLQPINITPVQPRLAETNLFILEGAGPADPAFNEFNPLFLRNRLALQASGVIGGNDTLGYEIVQSGVWNKFSYSVGGFDYETDGFRENNDLEQDIYNVFVQTSLSHKTSIQAEYRYKDNENGDLNIMFDPDDFIPTWREEEELHTIRVGSHHAFTPRSDLLVSFIYQRWDDDSNIPSVLEVAGDIDGYIGEIQHLFRAERYHLTSGVGCISMNYEEAITTSLPFPPFTETTIEEDDIDHTNLYVYSLINYPKDFTWTIGGSADFSEGGLKDRDQFNPKFGVTWNPVPATTIRGAVFRTLLRDLPSQQTVEPTQVAGFNQFFDDPAGTKSWLYGVGVDQKFSAAVYAGLELTKREMELPFQDFYLEIREADWSDIMGRIYLYWTPHRRLALSAEYQFEQLDRQADAAGLGNEVELETYRIPLGISFFHPLGFSARIKATYLDQEGKFSEFVVPPPPASPYFIAVPGADHFWVVDASIGYRLPKRWGLITIEAKNMFDEEFKYQDTDPANPRIAPESLILARFTLAF
jgi:tetratricopeptide (TPR) repeat protein